MSNSYISNSTANSGGSLYLGGISNIVNNIFESSSAKDKGGAYYVLNQTIFLNNSIKYCNANIGGKLCCIYKFHLTIL